MLNISIGQKKPNQITQAQMAAGQNVPEVPDMREPIAEMGEENQSHPQPLNQQSADGSQATSIEPDHFDDLLSGPEVASVSAGDSLPPGMLGKDEFFKVFCMVFKMASIGAHLKSMDVDPNDEGARAASDAVYETCAEIPALNFILKPQGRVMGRVAAIGMFVVPMAMNVQAEIAARQVPKKSAPGAASGSNSRAMVVPDYDMTGGR